MSSSTPNLNLSKPDEGDTDWAGEVNGNSDTLDTAVGTEHGASGIHKIAAGTSFPGSPVAGQIFLRTDEKILYRYSGSTWEQYGLKNGETAAGDLSGTLPSPTVAKIQGYSATSGAPAKGDLMEFDGSNWTHVRNRYRVLACTSNSYAQNTTQTVVSYAAAASEFSSNSTILAMLEFYNASAVGLTPRLKYGATQLYQMTQFTYNHNLVQIWSWVRPDSSSYEQHLQENYGGKEAGTTSVSANYISSAATWSVEVVFGSGGTTYVRAYLIEIRKE